jgi:hypothetical protein
VELVGSCNIELSMEILAIALAASLTIGVQEPVVTGSIAGCLSDIISQRLPGTTVTVKGGGVQRTTEAGGSGCYELKDLPAGSYRLTASLAGFSNVTRNKVVVAASTVTRLDFTMRISTICECVRVTRTLAQHVDYADAVFHVRISDDEPDGSEADGYYPHRGTVIAAVKRPVGQGSDGVLIRQNQRSSAAPLFDVGQELVVFLKSSGPDAFYITNDEPGLVTTGDRYPAMALLIQNGRILQAPSELLRYVGLPIETFLQELRAVLRRR